MRYDTEVNFVEEKKKYVPSLGKEASEVIHSKVVRVNLTDASEKVMKVTFGEVKQGVKVARLLGKLTFEPTHMLWGCYKYKVSMKRDFRHKLTYVLDEVTINGENR